MKPRCPHCDDVLVPVDMPDEGAWDSAFHMVCFNDDCSYYRKGWQWMEERFGVKTSYRYRFDPSTGKASPLAVWSPEALRDRILEADVTVENNTSA